MISEACIKGLRDDLIDHETRIQVLEVEEEAMKPLEDIVDAEGFLSSVVLVAAVRSHEVEIETIRLMVKVMGQRLTKVEEAVKALQQGLSESAIPWDVRGC